MYDLTDGKDLPGGFGWLTWFGSPSAPTLRDSLCTTDSPEYTFPVDIDGSSGKSNSSGVRNCLDGWITSGQTVLIPIYDTHSGHGAGSTYHVIGVAAFVITEVDQPAVGNIRGYFVENYAANTTPGGTGALPPGKDDISNSFGLVR